MQNWQELFQPTFNNRFFSLDFLDNIFPPYTTIVRIRCIARNDDESLNSARVRSPDDWKEKEKREGEREEMKGRSDEVWWVSSIASRWNSTRRICLVDKNSIADRVERCVLAPVLHLVKEKKVHEHGDAACISGNQVTRDLVDRSESASRETSHVTV